LTPQFHLADLFEIVAARVPERIALADERGTATYAQMNARADRLAAALAEIGVGRGDHVGLYLMNGPEYLESFFAVMKRGAVPFNVNYRYQLDELTYLFGNAEAVAVIHGAEFTDNVQALKAALPGLTISISVDMNGGGKAKNDDAGSHDYETLMQTMPRAVPFERSEDEYLLQYTGGTTGMPKGVMWPHKAFFYACLGGGGLYARKPPITAPEEQGEIAATSFPIRILPVAPLMHGAAIWTALSGLLGGVTMVLDPMRVGFDAEAIWDRVEREEVNILQIVGDAMAVPLLEALKNNPGRWDLSRLIHFGSGGAVFSQHVKDGLKANQSVIEDGCIVGVGETGFLSRTGHTPIGYYGDPEKTAEIFREIDGQLWVLTGDRARMDDDGMMTVLGRGSTCINSGGEKIYPEEVEEVLRAHPAVLDAAVIGLADPKWGQAVSAVISLKPGAEAPGLAGLQDHCREMLAGYKLPRALTIVTEIKRSPAGKQDYVWARSVFEDI